MVLLSVYDSVLCVLTSQIHWYFIWETREQSKKSKWKGWNIKSHMQIHGRFKRLFQFINLHCWSEPIFVFADQPLYETKVQKKKKKPAKHSPWKRCTNKEKAKNMYFNRIVMNMKSIHLSDDLFGFVVFIWMQIIAIELIQPIHFSLFSSSLVFDYRYLNDCTRKPITKIWLDIWMYRCMCVLF